MVNAYNRNIYKKKSNILWYQAIKERIFLKKVLDGIMNRYDTKKNMLA